jgi:ankyrin repeat protein
LAWNPDINAVDAKGLTPLHLSVKASEEIRSTKGIKLLLVKGADKNKEDKFGNKPIDLIENIPKSGQNTALI